MAYRNRLIGHADVDPESLLANPKNWRIHPHPQEEALAGVLAEVGWVDSVLVNQRTGFVIDGHLRVAHALSMGESSVPVDYVDLSEEEEDEVLATFDPLASLAVSDGAKLKDLLDGVETSNEALRRLLADVSANASTATMPQGTDLTPEDKLVVYENGIQRQIMLLFTADEYADVIWQFGKVLEAHPELETNVDVVKHLLQQEVGARAGDD
jgi:hypothetical protein